MNMNMNMNMKKNIIKQNVLLDINIAYSTLSSWYLRVYNRFAYPQDLAFHHTPLP